MGYSKKGFVISGIAILLLILFPLVAGTEHTLNLFIVLFITVILAQSWNILGGYAGQISLGNAAFFGQGRSVSIFSHGVEDSRYTSLCLQEGSQPSSWQVLSGFLPFDSRGSTLRSVRWLLQKP